ncbi:MAG: hypothetical protein JWP96_2526 [Polaromonas sp.]|jgi:hypothetical protein|nr:hypothetical protein [Polaromonas sp.]
MKAGGDRLERKKLRALVNLIDKDKKSVIHSGFEDELG